MGPLPAKKVLTELLPIKPATSPALIDVVFIHGLDGNAVSTWNDGKGESWSDWISASFPGANIWSLSYRLHSSNWVGGSMPLTDRALNVLATIQSAIVGDRPFVFICHSYGGLLLKQMLRTSRDIAPEYREVTDRIKGVVFLATPHNGSAIARYVQALRVLRSGPAIKELESNAALLRDLNQWFRKNVNIKGLRVRAYFETINTKGIRVVDEDSADPVIDGVVAVGIDADHIAICKPPEQDVRVKQTLALIGDVLREREQRVPNVEPSYIRTALACRFEDLERLKREIELYRKDRPEDAEAKQALLYIAGVRILGPTCGKYVTKAMRTVLQFLK